MRIREIFIVLVLIFSFLLPVSIVNAQTPEQRIEKLEQQVEKQDLLIDGYQKLLEESKNFREGVHQQVESFLQIEGIVVTIFMVIVSIIMYFIGQNQKETKEIFREMKEEAKKNLEKIRKKLEEEHEEEVRKIMIDSEGKLQNEIDKRYNEQLYKVLREKRNVEAIEQIVQNELSFVSSRVYLTCKTSEELDRLKKIEIPIMSEYGIKNITYSVFNKKEFEEEVKQKNIDLIIYSCEPVEKGQEDETLLQLVQFLIEQEAKIPLVVYTYQRHRLEQEMNNISKYPYINFSNFPATLLGNLYSLSYAFTRENKS